MKVWQTHWYGTNLRNQSRKEIGPVDMSRHTLPRDFAELALAEKFANRSQPKRWTKPATETFNHFLSKVCLGGGSALERTPVTGSRLRI